METVILDFYGQYCAPCKRLMKDLDELNSEMNLNIKKLDIEENYDLTEKYNVLSVPTLVVLKNNEIKSTYTGYKGKEDLIKFLQENL